MQLFQATDMLINMGLVLSDYLYVCQNMIGHLFAVENFCKHDKSNK